MPQIALEQTKEVSGLWAPKAFLKQVHEIIHQTIGASIASCKSRIITYDEYVIGDGEQNESFVYLTVNILSGRTEQVKIDLANRLYSELMQQFANYEIAETTAVRC